MKFNLFALSAIALCLLQQTQALSETQTQVYNGNNPEVVQENTIDPKTTQPKLQNNRSGGVLGSVTNVVGAVKRDGLKDVTDKLNLSDGGLLDLGLVKKLVGDLVETVTNLLGNDGLLKNVLDLAKEVIGAVKTILKQLLSILSKGGLLESLDLDGLDLTDLLKEIVNLKILDKLELVDGSALDVIEINSLLDTVTNTLNGLGGGAGDGALKNILELVQSILQQLLGAASNASGTKKGLLRRNVIKSQIAKRAI